MTDDRGLSGAATAPGPPPSPPGEAPLRRSRRHKVIGGVCGGFGRYYQMDPVIFRVPLVVLSVLGGLGLIVYGIAWLITPFEDQEENEGRQLLSGRVEGPGLTALLFVVAGLGLLLASLGNRGPTTWFAVLVLAALGAAAYWSRYRRSAETTTPEGVPTHRAAAQAVAEAPPEAQPPPAPSSPSWWRGGTPAVGYLWGPAHAEDGHHSPGPPAGQPPWPPAAGRPQPPVRRPEPREFRLGGLLFLLAALAFAIGVSAAWTSLPLGPVLQIGLASALAVYGIGLLVSAFAGRLGLGTITAVLLTGVMLAGASMLPENITTTWESHDWRPGGVELVRDSYQLGSGAAQLDLTAVEVAPGDELVTEVEAGAGQVTVLVPYDVDLTVRVGIGVGAFTYQPLRGLSQHDNQDSWGGLGEERVLEYPAVVPATEEGEEAAEQPRIELRVELGVGHVQVERAAEEPQP
ncbi:PspC domain-containing protein [Streptomyces sp. DSM 44915]|uniref:PspC domain-containing protein n=1 Tax=Streptomyces chisholmiae TaxID=3075540 RepID=A0ABU2JJR7_9ACTN|nr:PspC domain-containing protein [Streptomyces sp. DSM 44915]MDT0265231.1 PspC domain-containing protein [Streptomyces sp. DSM 44915]